VSFSRPVKESTLTSANLYITETSETSSLSTSWNPSLCDHGNAISTTVTLDDPQTVTIDLGNGLESGYFAICLSPNITDTDGTTFWGKTFQFKIYDPASPSGSCSLASFAQGKGHYSFLILFMSIAVLTVTRFRNNTT
jgi:hypothetical protein